MKGEKEQTEHVLEFLNLNFAITNHCLTIRDERGGADYCYDVASIELKNVCICNNLIPLNNIGFFYRNNIFWKS